MVQSRFDVGKSDQKKVEVVDSEVKDFPDGSAPDGPASASAIVNAKIFKK